MLAMHLWNTKAFREGKRKLQGIILRIKLCDGQTDGICIPISAFASLGDNKSARGHNIRPWRNCLNIWLFDTGCMKREMHIFNMCRMHVWSFRMIWLKTVRGVDYTKFNMCRMHVWNFRMIWLTRVPEVTIYARGGTVWIFGCLTLEAWKGEVHIFNMCRMHVWSFRMIG